MRRFMTHTDLVEFPPKFAALKREYKSHAYACKSELATLLNIIWEKGIHYTCTEKILKIRQAYLV